jgi:asparagine synthase (glutamine-hydrolysing)
MCGIAGYLTEAGRGDGALLRRMCGRLAHRGPDAYGSYLGPGVALGHRRLSIIDLAGGAQPLGNEDGTIQVVFNGEIYNYRELRKDLVHKGHRFATNSDTEVLVHLYEEAGERLPEYLNGMFALAIWDSNRRELFLARDPLGKKPLYYSSSVSGMRFCFASELKALTAIPGFPDAVNHRAVADFLQLSYVPDPETIYAGVSKLPPGHSLTVSRRGERLRKYWEPRLGGTWKRSVRDTAEEVRELAADSVKRRMISDVPLGGFLSGGVDSSAVVGFMSAASGERVKTFSIGFTDKAYDELEYARAAADRWKTEHHEQVVTPEVHDVLPVLVNHFDEPFGDVSAIPTLYLAKLARQHVTVALSGDGADELFGGYERYAVALRENRVRKLFPEWMRRSLFQFGAERYPALYSWPRVFRAKATLTFLSQQFGDAYFSTMSAFRDQAVEPVFSPEMKRSLGGYSAREHFRSRFEAVRELDPLQQMQAVDLETYLPGDILVKVDRATMAYSLEARCPWLDYRLAELACALPASYKLRDGIGKYIFKQAVAGHVSAALIARPKKGFGVPLAKWLRTSLKAGFEEMVLGGSLGEYLSAAEVRKLWAEHQSGARNHDRKLWNMLVLSWWEAEQRRPVEGEMAASRN